MDAIARDSDKLLLIRDTPQDRLETYYISLNSVRRKGLD